MPYTNYNEVGVNAENLEEFIECLHKFAERKSEVAAQRWLLKLNPEVERHVQMELTSTGDGYTARVAKAVVHGEFMPQPLPCRCPDCGDVMWYRATASVMKCQGCGEVGFDKVWM